MTPEVREVYETNVRIHDERNIRDGPIDGLSWILTVNYHPCQKDRIMAVLR